MPSTVATELNRINAMTMEGRTAISNLTTTVNSLVDLPNEITRLARTVQNRTRNEPTRPAHSVPYNKCMCTGRNCAPF